MIAAVDADTLCHSTGEKEIAHVPAANLTSVSSNSLEWKGLSLKTLTSLDQIAAVRTKVKPSLSLLSCPPHT